MIRRAPHAAGRRAGPRRCPAFGSLGVLALALGAALAAGCGPQYRGMAEARADYARAAQGPVVVAAVEDPLGPELVRGIELAVREIQIADGGLLGRPIEVRRFPGSDALRQVRGTAWRIARDPRISAVLGHRRSEVAVPASVIYERAQVLFLPSFATAEQLTRHGFDFVLRTLPDHAAMAAQTASVAELLGHRRIAVLHSRDDYARELAFLFEDEARARGLHIAFRASFFGSEANFRGLLGQLNAVSFDAVYLSAEHAAGARLLRQLRELGFEQPVLGSDRLAYGDLATLAGPAGDRTLAPGVYDAGSLSPRNRAFAAAYRAAYGSEPNQDAAQGYDLAGLFAHIVRRAGDTEPRLLAATARWAPPYAGVTGIFAYDPRGNVYGKLFEFRVLRFGRWWSLPGVTAPYRFASFQAARQEMGRERSLRAGVPMGGDRATELGGGASGETPGAALPASAPAALSAARQAAGAMAAGGGSPGASGPAAEAGGAAGGAGAPAASDHLGPFALTAARLSAAERDRVWLALAHEILGFRRLGLVAPQTGAGAAALDLARTLARERGFALEVCELPRPDAAPAEPAEPAASLRPDRLSGREPAPEAPGDPTAADFLTPDSAAPGAAARTPLERAALRCWSRLARAADAMLTVPDSGLRPDLVRRLNRALRRFGVPSFALAETLDDDLGLTLALVGSGVELSDPEVAMRFDGVLRGLRVHQLDRQLANLPAVSVDLEAFAELGLRPDPRLLVLVSRAIEPGFAAPPSSAAAPAP